VGGEGEGRVRGGGGTRERQLRSWTEAELCSGRIGSRSDLDRIGDRICQSRDDRAPSGGVAWRGVAYELEAQRGEVARQLGQLAAHDGGGARHTPRRLLGGAHAHEVARQQARQRDKGVGRLHVQQQHRACVFHRGGARRGAWGAGVARSRRSLGSRAEHVRWIWSDLPVEEKAPKHAACGIPSSGACCDGFGPPKQRACASVAASSACRLSCVGGNGGGGVRRGVRRGGP